MAPKKKRPARKAATYRKPTYPSARRIARLVAEFPRNTIGRELSGVCGQFGVKERTIRRDIKMLNEELPPKKGEPPEFEIETRPDGSKWLVRRPRESGRSGATIYNLVSMYLSLEFLRLLENAIIAPPLEELMEKVESMIPESQRALLRQFPRKFFAAPSPHKDYSSEQCAEVLEDAIAAIVHQNELTIHYKRLGQEQPREMRVQPLTLLHHRGSLYLIAIKKGRANPFYYSLERIKAAQRHREDRFEYPDDYNPRRLLDGAFGVFSRKDKIKTLRIRFPPELREYIMSWKVHETQKFEEQNDGSAILAMKVTDSDEVRSWIRSFGETAEILD